MADHAIAPSNNGVRLFITLTDEKNDVLSLILSTPVTRNVWTKQSVDISAYVGYQTTLRIEADAMGNDYGDWLQVYLILTQTFR